VSKFEEQRLKRYEAEREKWLLRQSGQKQKWKIRIRRVNGDWETRKYTGDRDGARERLIEIMNTRSDYDYGWIIWEQT
jgi:hypothetical protein